MFTQKDNYTQKGVRPMKVDPTPIFLAIDQGISYLASLALQFLLNQTIWVNLHPMVKVLEGLQKLFRLF